MDRWRPVVANQFLAANGAYSQDAMWTYIGNPDDLLDQPPRVFVPGGLSLRPPASTRWSHRAVRTMPLGSIFR